MRVASVVTKYLQYRVWEKHDFDWKSNLGVFCIDSLGVENGWVLWLLIY